MIMQIISLIILIILASIILRFVMDIGSSLLKILAHFITGWILLTITNFLPGIYVPINLFTLIISGFGGVFGTVVLAIFYLIF